jgi:hypothetical protein
LQVCQGEKQRLADSVQEKASSTTHDTGEVAERVLSQKGPTDFFGTVLSAEAGNQIF